MLFTILLGWVLLGGQGCTAPRHVVTRAYILWSTRGYLMQLREHMMICVVFQL